ncbi:MAG: calcium/proton exchanger [Planctomycetota bacterium]|nr:calcium/proton exchanger [Planctomycetota bacterium]
MPTWLKPSLNWLLVFVPISAGMEYFTGDAKPHTWIFICSCLAVIPLAGWMGKATEHLAEKTGEGIGGLLNATFGNAAEMIIALMALHAGKYEIVKASLTGSIIGNILLVLGASCLAGGLRFKKLTFNAVGARTQSTMMTLAAIGLIAPMAYHFLAPHVDLRREQDLSMEVSIVLLITYAASLFFSLHTHKNLFAGEAAEASRVEASGAHLAVSHASWSLGKSIGVLVGATVLVAWVSEFLVGSVEHAAHALGMTDVFVGVIVVAIIGNAAEHSTAILVAMKNRMDLSLSIAIGSSLQIALFVAPVLVLASYALGPQAQGPMNLVFTPAEVLAVVVSVAICGQIAGDGESNWLEGVQLLMVYVILGIVFFFLPEAAQTHEAIPGH